jgi:hypothetical protein
VRHHGHRAREGKTPAVGALASGAHLTTNKTKKWHCDWYS